MQIWIRRGEKNLGGFTVSQVQQGLERGEFLATDLAWRDGSHEDWTPIAKLPGLLPPPQSVNLPPYPPPPELMDNDSPEAGLLAAPAWERRPAAKLIPALFTTFREALFEPHRTFPRMRLDGRFGPPTSFLAVVLLLSLGTSMVFRLIAYFSSDAFNAKVDFTLEQRITYYFVFVTGALIIPLALLLLAILLALAVNFVVIWIYHLILKVLGGANKGYAATYKVLAYSQASHVFSIIPFVGWVVDWAFFVSPGRSVWRKYTVPRAGSRRSLCWCQFS